jgi:hypothetical protein
MSEDAILGAVYGAIAIFSLGAWIGYRVGQRSR